MHTPGMGVGSRQTDKGAPMASNSNPVRTVKDRLAKRRAEKPERLRRQAEAKSHRLEMKRSHESNPKDGGGGG